MDTKDITVKVPAAAEKDWTGKVWTVRAGDVTEYAPTLAAASTAMVQTLAAMAEKAWMPSVLVMHDDGTLTMCEVRAGAVRQVRVRDGRVCVTNVSDWATPMIAALEAIEPDCFGPGQVIRL